jgi:uncharacterized protein (DUF885 family)
MTTAFEISDELTERWADADPINATTYGIGGRDHLCTDYSPDGHQMRVDLYREMRDRLAAFCDHADPSEAFAARVMTGWLEEQIEEHDAGKWRRDLNHVYSPFQVTRDVFDVMERDTPEAWVDIEARLRGFPAALDGYALSLKEGLATGDTAAARQVETVLQQLDAAASDRSRFTDFIAQAERAGAGTESFRIAVDQTRAACAGLAGWLRDSYLPEARPSDAVGRDEYLREADHHLGLVIDPEATYEWAWGEVHRLREAMATTSAAIDPDRSVDEVIEMLETDPARAAATRDEFVEFISDLQHQAIDQLAGAHFDVEDELRTVTVNIAPPGGSLGAWYVPPAEDFSRPGSIWYAPGERESLPYWQEVSTAYHEGFPGHHLQVGTVMLERENLSRFQRSVIWYSGAGEGWALYAERLMDELGFFEKPEYRLGLLASQLFRSTRVVVDIGCHLEMTIPDHAPLHAGEVWSHETAVDYIERIGLQPHDVAVSEVLRYLGWPGQAITYKVGEREILAMRHRAREKGDFVMKDFHRQMLAAGPIRLDQLAEVMA